MNIKRLSTFTTLVCICTLSLLFIQRSLYARGGFGECFGGSMLGSFTGSMAGTMIGNAASRPRYKRSETIYQKPSKTHIIQVSQPECASCYANAKQHTCTHSPLNQQDTSLEEKKLEIQKMEAEAAKLNAENEKLKLEIEQLKLKSNSSL